MANFILALLDRMDEDTRDFLIYFGGLAISFGLAFMLGFIGFGIMHSLK